MEPLDDKELKHLTSQWHAPDAPASLDRRVLPQPAPWWHWLFKGSIRIPAPIGVAAVLLLALWAWFGRTEPEVASPGIAPSTLADFQPVEQLHPTLVERNNEGRQ